MKTFFLMGIVSILLFTMDEAHAATTKCSIPRPCALFENIGSGRAIEADANRGPGVVGTTDSGNALLPGVEGESQNPDGFDAAAGFGLNFVAGGSPPAYGVLSYGFVSGTYGETEAPGTSSSFGAGLNGVDAAGNLSADKNTGVLGVSTYGTGVIGEANGTPSDDYFGAERIGGYFVGNNSGAKGDYALGLDVESNQVAAEFKNTTYDSAISVAPPDALLDGFVGNSFFAFTFDNSGNERLAGSLYTNSTFVRTQSATGRAKIAYGAQTTRPQMEDIGDAQLTNGRAYVPIDGELADVIDQRTSYHVFLTPKGDCNGLYVSQETSSGFVVRELHGGRSTLAFDYRIVAKPRGEEGTRLAAAPEEPRPFRPLASGRKTTATVPHVETPLQRLERILGPAAAARALREFQAERSVAAQR